MKARNYTACLLCLILFSPVVFLSNSATSQTRQETIRTSARQVQIGEVASQELQTLLPEAVESVVYTDGKSETRNLNYNILYDHFFYSDRRGRTLWLGPRDVDSVRLGDSLFRSFEDEGFFVVVPGIPELLVRHNIDISTETLTRGAYGTTNETASIEVLRAITTASGANGSMHTAYLENPGGQELRITLKREEKFYVLKEGEVLDASNRRALQRAFPEHRREIRRYVRNNDIDFESLEDLSGILEHLSSLD